MKRIYFFIATLIAVGAVTSCSSSDTEENPTANALPAILNLNLNAGQIISRSGASTAEATINKGYAAAFDGNSAITGTVQSFSGSTPSINTTTQATQISVAVNQGGTSTTQFASAIKNKTDFESVTTDLASTVTTGSGKEVTDSLSQDATKLPMYGNVSGFTLNGTTPTAVSVDMHHLVAKVVLKTITMPFAGGYASATFEPKEIFMYNTNTICSFGGASNTPVSGESTNANCAGKAATNYKYLSTGYIPTYSSSTPYTFYVFPHDKTTPTKIVVKGIFKADGVNNPVTVYYPIVINKFIDATTTVIKKDNGSALASADADDSKIVANTCYTITLTIKGKGMANPDTDIVPATANVTFNVVAWTDYTQDVTVQ